MTCFCSYFLKPVEGKRAFGKSIAACALRSMVPLARFHILVGLLDGLCIQEGPLYGLPDYTGPLAVLFG